MSGPARRPVALNQAEADDERATVEDLLAGYLADDDPAPRALRPHELAALAGFTRGDAEREARARRVAAVLDGDPVAVPGPDGPSLARPALDLVRLWQKLREVE